MGKDNFFLYWTDIGDEYWELKLVLKILMCLYFNINLKIKIKDSLFVPWRAKASRTGELLLLKCGELIALGLRLVIVVLTKYIGFNLFTHFTSSQVYCLELNYYT